MWVQIYSKNKLFDQAYQWCLTSLPVEPVYIGSKEREVNAIDSSTVGRWRAKTGMDLLGKGRVWGKILSSKYGLYKEETPQKPVFRGEAFLNRNQASSVQEQIFTTPHTPHPTPSLHFNLLVTPSAQGSKIEKLSENSPTPANQGLTVTRGSLNW
jgi:hypothetical protein